MLPFTVWDLLLFNKWHTWWGNWAIISDAQWRLSWPIITIVSALTIVTYATKRLTKKREVEVLVVFVICYGLFLSIGTPTVRYFVIYLPILYIIAIFGVQQIVLKIAQFNHKHTISTESAN